MSEVSSTQWNLVARPSGRPLDSDVELVSVPVPVPGPGQVLVSNAYMSLEPSMRGRMDERTTSYVPPYGLGEAMQGRAIGVVTASTDASIPVGSTVLHNAGWREYALVEASECELVDKDPDLLSVRLTLLGLVGMTAWVGLVRIARVRPGDVVFINSAAGGVGSTAVQIAKALGATVIASAGSEDKLDLLRGLGADAVFNHRAGRAKDLLGAAVNEVGATGLDVVFENVGGDQLEAAITLLNDHARIALCGMISVYNSAEPLPGPRNLIRLIWRRASMTGFLLHDHVDARPEFEREMTAWIRSGQVRPVQRVVDGIEQAWPAFLDMLDGTAAGKTLVALPSAATPLTNSDGPDRAEHPHPTGD